MSEPKLLPCPFCGGDPYTEIPERVGCSTGCMGRYVTTYEGWNTRVPSEQEKRLEAALQEIAGGVFPVSDVNKVTMEVVSAMADIARRALEDKP